MAALTHGANVSMNVGGITSLGTNVCAERRKYAIRLVLWTPPFADVPRQRGDWDMVLGGGQAPGVPLALLEERAVVTQTLSGNEQYDGECWRPQLPSNRGPSWAQRGSQSARSAQQQHILYKLTNSYQLVQTLTCSFAISYDFFHNLTRGFCV